MITIITILNHISGEIQLSAMSVKNIIQIMTDREGNRILSVGYYPTRGVNGGVWKIVCQFGCMSIALEYCHLYSFGSLGSYETLQ